MIGFRRVLLWMAVSATAGCSETRLYQLSVRNDLPVPVTVCLTKSKGSAEAGWVSPEQLALPPHPASDNTPPGFVIPPGRVANRPQVQGEFDPSTGRAYLRVYQGTPGLNEMIGIGPDSPRRVDVLLHSGPNRFTIEANEDGKLTVVRTAANPTADRTATR
jgi:hypothetical protein